MRHQLGYTHGQQDRHRHGDKFSRRDQLRLDLLGQLRQRNFRHADGHGGRELFFYRLERGLHGDGQLRRCDGLSEIGYGDVYSAEFRADTGEGGRRQRHRHQLSFRDQLRFYMLGELQQRDLRDPDGHGGIRLYFRGLERRLYRDRQLRC
jgi:hypothetical protein